MSPLDAAFQKAQWDVSYGWHVEGQILPLEWGGWVAAATWRAPNRAGPPKGTVTYAFGYTPILALANLGRRFLEQPRGPHWMWIAAPARAHRLIILPALRAELAALRAHIDHLLGRVRGADSMA